MNANDIVKKVNNSESFLLANDGQYLGKLTLNTYDSESIMNPYGTYGSRYASTSIWNSYSNYGSPYSSLSPYNPYTSTPPTIYLRGKKFGLLTKNRFLGYNNIDPDNLINWMNDNHLNR